VEQLLHRPFGAYRTMVFALCGLIMIIEGFDMYMVGNIVPTLAQAFRTEPAMIALIFSAQGVGLALGYAIVSPLADRFGRRPTVLACILMFSLLTLAAAAADSVGQLAMLRLAAFIFFGGVIPNVIALVTEISSFGQRQRVVVLLSALYAIGAATAGFIAPALAERFGWSGIFLLGGAIPLIILPLLFLVLPESPRFLVLKDPAGDRARRVIGKVVGEPFPAGATFRLSEPVTGKLPAAALFAPERRRTTFLIAGMSAMSVLVLNMVAAWLPTYLHIYGGFPMVTAARIVASSVIGAILLPILLSLLIQRVGASLAVAVCSVIAAAGLMLFAVSPLSVAVGVAISILFGAFVVGAQGGINAIASSAYPTEMRATGIGWTAGFGRLVAIAGPAIGGILLAMQFSQLAIAIVFAAPMLIVAAAALALPRQRGE
jgi:AAHS family 4-hydroxybenzoate transporter-like MFS transporter